MHNNDVNSKLSKFISFRNFKVVSPPQYVRGSAAKTAYTRVSSLSFLRPRAPAARIHSSAATSLSLPPTAKYYVFSPPIRPRSLARVSIKAAIFFTNDARIARKNQYGDCCCCCYYYTHSIGARHDITKRTSSIDYRHFCIPGTRRNIIYES